LMVASKGAAASIFMKDRRPLLFRRRSDKWNSLSGATAG
jgi:hypothetical protein